MALPCETQGPLGESVIPHRLVLAGRVVRRRREHPVLVRLPSTRRGILAEARPLRVNAGLPTQGRITVGPRPSRSAGPKAGGSEPGEHRRVGNTGNSTWPVRAHADERLAREGLCRLDGPERRALLDRPFLAMKDGSTRWVRSPHGRTKQPVALRPQPAALQPTAISPEPARSHPPGGTDGVEGGRYGWKDTLPFPALRSEVGGTTLWCQPAARSYPCRHERTNRHGKREKCEFESHRGFFGRFR